MIGCATTGEGVMSTCVCIENISCMLANRVGYGFSCKSSSSMICTTFVGSVKLSRCDDVIGQSCLLKAPVNPVLVAFFPPFLSLTKRPCIMRCVWKRWLVCWHVANHTYIHTYAHNNGQ